jgi:hypothetical protein
MDTDKDYMKGMSEDEYAAWQESMRNSVIDNRVEAIKSSWEKYNTCECNGGPPCDCPDCDHPDCGYKDKPEK